MTIIQKKAKAKRAKPVTKAVPVIRKPKDTDADKIGITRQITSAMKVAPLWNASPALQAANTAWNAAANAVEPNATSVKEARAKLAAAEAIQRAVRQDWLAATKQMTAVAEITAQGSPDQVSPSGSTCSRASLPRLKLHRAVSPRCRER